MAVVLEERRSAAAWWCRRCSGFALFLGLVAIFAHRFGFIESWPFLMVLAVVAGLAVFALVLAVSGFQRVWYLGDRGGKNLTMGVLTAFLVLAPFAFAGWLAYHYPPLDQATTDLEDPPVIHRVDSSSPPVRMLDVTGIAQHTEAYPDLTGRRYTAPIDQVLVAVETLMESRGWSTSAVPTSESSDVEFVIDTTARLPVLYLPYDVAIRLTDEGNATYVDMRAAARFGTRDLGVDAWLIEGFLTELDKQAGTLAGIVVPPAEPPDEAPIPTPQPQQ